MTRVGILGGTFDPIHVGHLVLAAEVRDAARLDRVLFIPTATPPHKPTSTGSSARDRLEMVRRATASEPAFEVSDLEIRRGGVSYTIDTVEALQAERPEVAWEFLAGADCLHDLPDWHRAEELLARIPFRIASRAGFDVEGALAVVRERLGEATADDLASRIVGIPSIGVSSSDLRRRVAEGRTIRYLVPRPVEAYVRQRGLYRRGERANP